MEKSECKNCNFIILNSYYFCPNCGKKLIEPPLATSIIKQIGVYALSFFLPPFGIFPAIKYIKQKNTKAKIIGLISIILTIISLIISYNILLSFFNNPLGIYSSNQLNQLQNLGY